MNIDEIVDWADKNTIGWEVEGDPRLTYFRIELERLVKAAFDCVLRGGLMMEVGVYAGRSLAALLGVARELKAGVAACDPFVWHGDIAEPRFTEMCTHFTDVPFRFYHMTSAQAWVHFPDDAVIDLLHIDGDHYDAGTDCKLWLPLLRPRGLVVFHDVVNDPRSPVYEGVYCAIQPYIKDWELLWWAQEEAGHQMCRRKP